jgi:hypothetical protein
LLVKVKGQDATYLKKVDQAGYSLVMSRYKIQKVAIGFKVEVVTIPEINDKYICINKDSYLFLVQCIASFALLNFGLLFFRVSSMSFHASPRGRKETFSSDSEVTGDIKAKGFPLKVTTTFSPFETLRIASPVLFFRCFAVIILIGSS